MEMVGWILPAVLVALILLLLYLYGTWTYTKWRKYNIPGPAPVPFLGNMMDILKKGLFNASLDWRRKYGKTFGVYFMRESMLLTNDLDIIKEVFLKDFSNFTERSNVPRRTAPYPLNLSVVFTMGDNWRRIRHTMTPTFSTGRLKLMGRYISRCCDNLSSAFQRLTEKQELADVKRIFGAYTIDVIAGTAFGLETDSLVRENNPFLKAIVKMFQKSKTLGWRSAFLTLFPFLSPVLLLLRLSDAPTEEVNNVVRLIDQLIDDRRKNGDNERVDLLHLLLEAEASEADIAAKPQDRQLTRVEIIAQSMLIFIAGYETTATTLHYMTYLLALNPNKQEKLYNEIIAAIGDAPPTYENVMNIKYLDNVIRETLRSFPPVPLIGRRAVEARTIKGVHIEAGSCIGVPLYAFTHDEETFSDPDKFIPERFDDKDMPTVISELAFGMGPRQCIGMRLALYEAKMAAVTIIRRFRFIKVPETPMMITFRRSTLSSPEKPILLGVEPRK
ncbi:cytochrome P450 3A21-like [Pomacea canaliculata]|uniref:cytochrome P450 3A21-like n=1 Tax=Pomacea canaliculata TaxID=400727 RepID=UPI000D72A947|nr:cytochrome P450 3A21-like [Pomacea canaliculata]